MKRKILLTALAAASCACLIFGLTACGGGSFTEGLVYESTEDGSAYIVSGFNEPAEAPESYRVDVHIPAVYKGRPVIGIREGAFEGVRVVRSVEIPESITYIANSAFLSCSSLLEVTLGGVETIGAEAFANCSKLTTVHYGTALKEIGAGAFKNCTNLGYIEETLEDGTVSSVSRDFTLPEGLEVIGAEAFENDGFESVNIPAEVREIGARAFSGCYNLGKGAISGLNASGAVTRHIGEDAFLNTYYYYQTSSWTSDVLYLDSYLLEARTAVSGSYMVASGTKAIADNAFENCTLLTGITVPASVELIGNEVFSYCENLASITVAAGNPSYTASGNCLVETATNTLVAGASANVTIPASVTAIGDYAFFGRTALETIAIPSPVKTIGVGAFYDCNKLTELNLAGVQSIGGFAFAKTGITQVTLPDAITTIAHDVFLDCAKLQTVSLPGTLTLVENNAFAGCYAIQTVNFRGSEAAWKQVSVRGNENVTLTHAQINFNA